MRDVSIDQLFHVNKEGMSLASVSFRTYRNSGTSGSGRPSPVRTVHHRPEYPGSCCRSPTRLLYRHSLQQGVDGAVETCVNYVYFHEEMVLPLSSVRSASLDLVKAQKAGLLTSRGGKAVADVADRTLTAASVIGASFPYAVAVAAHVSGSAVCVARALRLGARGRGQTVADCAVGRSALATSVANRAGHCRQRRRAVCHYPCPTATGDTRGGGGPGFARTGGVHGWFGREDCRVFRWFQGGVK